ncbi:MAG: GGDEF domain-containing protein [Pirellulales bacterium]|nr:GGDEF domain-containing protein [Pirellulales bacterium]
MSDVFHTYLADTVALAAVALIGYLFGHRTTRSTNVFENGKLQQESSRATLVAQELQQIATRIRQDLASHQTNIARFRARLDNLQDDSSDEGWQKLRAEAETLLVPTMKLTTDLSMAYDQLRKKTLLLMDVAGSRTDPQTGIHNRRAMEEQLDMLFSLHEQHDSRFSLTLFSVDWSVMQTDGSDQLLRTFAELLNHCARDTDVVARYSADEFVVLMPQTSLAGATIFSERLLRRIHSELQLDLAGGIVEVQKDEDAEKMLSRADSALYSARADGTSCLYQHLGPNILPQAVETGLALASAETAI